jgi:uncharacterized damage-inducible protein DinB
VADEPKEVLHRYLTTARDSMVWKLDGLGEYDLRRPLVPTGTNLLGLVKHVASVADGYFGDVFGRPSGEPLPWFEDDAEPNADMWAAPDESRADILALWDRAWARVDATIEALDLGSEGHVPWWSEGRDRPTLHTIIVHMIAETNRHAGQADIIREMIDGAVGLRAANDNLPEQDDTWWTEYLARVEAAAGQAAASSLEPPSPAPSSS